MHGIDRKVIPHMAHLLEHGALKFNLPVNGDTEHPLIRGASGRRDRKRSRMLPAARHERLVRQVVLLRLIRRSHIGQYVQQRRAIRLHDRATSTKEELAKGHGLGNLQPSLDAVKMPIEDHGMVHDSKRITHKARLLVNINQPRSPILDALRTTVQVPHLNIKAKAGKPLGHAGLKRGELPPTHENQRVVPITQHIKRRQAHLSANLQGDCSHDQGIAKARVGIPRSTGANTSVLMSHRGDTHIGQLHRQQRGKPGSIAARQSGVKSMLKLQHRTVNMGVKCRCIKLHNDAIRHAMELANDQIRNTSGVKALTNEAGRRNMLPAESLKGIHPLLNAAKERHQFKVVDRGARLDKSRCLRVDAAIAPLLTLNKRLNARVALASALPNLHPTQHVLIPLTLATGITGNNLRTRGHGHGARPAKPTHENAEHRLNVPQTRSVGTDHLPQHTPVQSMHLIVHTRAMICRCFTMSTHLMMKTVDTPSLFRAQPVVLHLHDACPLPANAPDRAEANRWNINRAVLSSGKRRGTCAVPKQRHVVTQGGPTNQHVIQRGLMVGDASRANNSARADAGLHPGASEQTICFALPRPNGNGCRRRPCSNICQIFGLKPKLPALTTDTRKGRLQDILSPRPKMHMHHGKRKELETNNNLSTIHADLNPRGHAVVLCL
nr:MAG: RNA-dependent RNA polymerase [Hangzhou tombus-like virus 2]